jgi:hypothetical protein
MARYTINCRLRGRAFSTIKVVVALPAFVMMTWFGVEIAVAVRAMDQARAAADSIAVAAAARARDGYAAARTDALAAASACRGPNGPVSVSIGDGPGGGQDLQFGDWDEATRTFTPNPEGGHAARVTVRFAADHPNGTPSPVLSGLFGSSSLAIERSSVAVHVRARHTTSLYLHTKSDVALLMAGSSKLDADGGVSVRSSGEGCVAVGPDASLAASVVRVAGSVDPTVASQIDARVIDGFGVPADPFAAVALPALDSSAAIAVDHDDASVTQVAPGVHEGLTVTGGSVVLLPGLHQFVGSVEVKGAGSLVLQDATIQLDAAAALTVSGQGTVTGTPSLFGDWAGAWIIQRAASEPWSVGGLAVVDVAGMAYAPDALVTVQADGQLSCGSAMLGALQCSDSAVVGFDDDIDALKDTVVPGRARLVR